MDLLNFIIAAGADSLPQMRLVIASDGITIGPVGVTDSCLLFYGTAIIPWCKKKDAQKNNENSH